MSKNSIRHELMEGFSTRLKQAMERREINQSQLSLMINRTQPQIYHYLSGKSYPRLEVLQKLAFKLKVSYQWLKLGEGSMIVNTDDLIDSFQKTFPERLIYLLWTHNLRPIDLSTDLNTSSTLITYWIEGIRLPTKKNMQKLCEYFDVSESYLAPQAGEFLVDFHSAKELGLTKQQYLVWRSQNS